VPVGELAALATACSWSLTALFFAEASRRVGALLVNLLRLPLALGLLSFAVAVSGGASPHLSERGLLFLAASGIVGLVIGDFALLSAFRRIEARLAMLVMALAPVFASWAALLLLGERLGPRALLGMAVTLAGVVWVVSERRSGGASFQHRGAGVVLALIGAVCQGVGLVLAKAGMADGVPPLAATWVRMAVAAAGVWLIAICGRRIGGLGLAAAVRKGWWCILGGAVFGPFLGVWCSLIAARATDIGVAATIMATTPVLIIPLVMVTERYRPSLRSVAGTVVTIVGVALLFAR
jgi:drug/metabolite transporter (DMT)-like permease